MRSVAGGGEEGHDFAARGGGFCFRPEGEQIRDKRDTCCDQHRVNRMNEGGIPEAWADEARTEQENDGKVR